METIPNLISEYIDGELAEEDGRRLAELLAAQPAALDSLVLSSFIHSQLLDWLAQRHGQHAPTTAAFAGSISACELVDRQVANIATNDDFIASPWETEIRPTERAHRRTWLRTVAALAAAVLVTASVATVTYVVATRPIIVGQLTQATACKWQSSQSASLAAGALLHRGQQLALLEGQALITFSNGTQFFMEGPTSLQLDSPSQVRLHAGRVAAKVPTPARGFTVASSLARFVDLGTEFSLQLQAEKSFDIHVFEGLVELQLDPRFGEASRRPLKVTEVRAFHFDVDSGDIEQLHFEEGKDMPF